MQSHQTQVKHSLGCTKPRTTSSTTTSAEDPTCSRCFSPLALHPAAFLPRISPRHHSSLHSTQYWKHPPIFLIGLVALTHHECSVLCSPASSRTVFRINANGSMHLLFWLTFQQRLLISSKRMQEHNNSYISCLLKCTLLNKFLQFL